MGLVHDITFSFRLLWKNRGFAAAAILILALAIGANSTIFTLVNSILLRQLPFGNSDGLVWIWSTRTDRDKAFFSIPNLIDTREQATTLSAIAAFANWGANLTESGEAERLQGVRISANAFEMLGVQAAVGRTLQPSDGLAGSQRTVVLAHGLWQRRFGGDRAIAGRAILLNGDAYTVAGILPSNFVFPGADAEMAVPLILETDPRRGDRGSNFLRVFAHLKDGVTPGQAQDELSAITARLRDQYPEANAKHTNPRVLPLRDEIVGNYKTSLWTLLGAVGVVLLIGCSNLASMLLTRSSIRRREIAVRLALGARRARLMRQLLVESLLLALIGGGLGLAIASWAVHAVVGWAPADMPRIAEIGIDARVLGFTIVVSFVSVLFFGLVPAWQGSKADLIQELKESARGSTGGLRSHRTRKSLVVCEVALSVVLLVTAGLFIRSFARIQAVQAGIDTRNVLTVRLSLPVTQYDDREKIKFFYETLSARIRGVQGVDSVGLVSALPLSGINNRFDFTIVGRPPATIAEVPAAQNRWVTPGYLQTMRIPIHQGRDFNDHDVFGSQHVVAIDETLARQFWPNGDSIGKHLKSDFGEFEIVGVVGPVKHFGLDEQPLPTLYVPIAQIPSSELGFLANGISVVVRTFTDPVSIGEAVRREVRGVDSNVPASGVRTMDQLVSAAVAPRRFNLALIEMFAAAALLLAAIGLYGVISYSLTLRRHEIGVRMALGARRRDVISMVLREALTLAGIGTAVGILLSMLAGRALSQLLFGVSATDAVTLVTVSILVGATAVAASYLPAHRAAKVDAATIMRYQ